MAGNSTNSIAEFQKLRQETSGISWNLMLGNRAVDSPRSSHSKNLILKLIDDNSEAIRREFEKVQMKQEENLKAQLDAQNRIMKELLGELRFARIEIAEMKSKFESIEKRTEQIQKCLQDPSIADLCGRWQKSYSNAEQSQLADYDLQWLANRQKFYEQGDTLYWLYSRKKSYFLVAEVRVGSDQCKIKADGNIEIETDIQRVFELEVNCNTLTIHTGLINVSYKKC